MPDPPLHNLNDLLAELEDSAVTTTQGSFVKMEDVRRLLKDRADATSKASDGEPPPKTVEQARAQIKKDPELLKQFEGRPPDLGKSIPAQEPQSSSRT